MIELKGTSWQQRYSMKEIFTLQCRILDKPAMLAKLCDIIAQTGSQISEIKLTGVDGQYLLRDITIFSPDKEQVKKRIEQARVNGWDSR